MLKGVRLFVSDKCQGLVESLGEFYPAALWQRCAVHFYRNVWTAVPTSKVKEVGAMLKAVHAQDDRAAARQKAEQVAAKPKEMKLADAAALVVAGIEETLYYCAFPREHWRCLRTSNPLERLLREVRRNVFERVPNVAPALVTMPNVVSPPSGECGEGSQGIHDSRRGR